MESKVKYFVKIDTSNWNSFQKSWLTYNKIVGMIKHPNYGYVIPKKNVQNIIKTKRIRVNVWPDNDSFNFWQDYDVAKNVNCIGGTSIGGIITCGLMAGCKNEDLLNGFIENGEKIFTKRWQNKVNILNIPFYDNVNLKETIKKFVGDKTIKDTRNLYPNTSMFVPATNMTKNKLKLFDNVNGKDDNYSLLYV